MEELKHTSCANYESFIAENLESFNQCRINELQVQGRRIRACFNGWVILSSHLGSVLWSLWNPLTSKFIRLPSLIRDSHSCCLLPLPDDQGLVFMLLSDKIPTIVFCRLDPNKKRKRLKWTEMSYAKQLRSIISGVDDCFLESPTCCNSKVYALALGTHYRSVIHLDFVVRGKEVVISLVPLVKVPHTSPSSFHTIYSFLKGYCTKLFYIELVHFKDETRILEVRLFTLDMTSMVWEELEDLKDDILFLDLSSYSVFYKSAVASQIRGCVHILGAMDNIISFHVKERTMSPSSVPCIVRESQMLVWAMLECRLEADRPEAKQDQDTEVIIRSVNCDETEFDSKTSESHLLNVPFHILEMIMEHCFGDEYMNFRATCKRCYLAAPLLRRSQMYSPWLMVFDNYGGLFTFIGPICGNKYTIKKPQELKGDCRILCSRYGWLLLLVFKSHGCELVFFNPFTSDIRKLPEAPCRLGSLCFSEPPTSPDCMVVGFTIDGPCIHFVSREPPSWCRLDFGTNDPFSFRFPTFSGRDIYALCENKEKVEVLRDVSKEGYSREVVVDKAPSSCCGFWGGYHLSKCDQHLLLVIVAPLGTSVEVFKQNNSTKEWEKIYDLGKHMIYISTTSCICLEAKLPEMGNKIYFPRLLHIEDTKFMFYSLQTCMYHTFDDKNIQECFGADLQGTTYLCNPHTWIEPSWS
ncbi:hypothetical protein Hdeb2414_s0007g00256571 [Helianthus debilis subsp. tardiflorus]